MCTYTVQEMARQEVRFERVTNAQEIPAMAELSTLALQPDTFTVFTERERGISMYDDTLQKMTDAFNDPGTYIFKALLTMKDMDGKEHEIIVGVAQWYIGYLHVPKYDPFAPKDPIIVEPKVTILSEAMRLSGNAYVSAIRAKKHICKYHNCDFHLQNSANNEIFRSAPNGSTSRSTTERDRKNAPQMGH